MKKLYAMTSALLVLASPASQAAELFAQAGLHFGGDELATATFVGGGSESVEAGGLLSGDIGMIFDINETVEARASFGIKIDLVLAENGDLDFTRFPLEAMLFTKGEQIRFGAGVTWHLAPDLSGSVPGSSINVSFDDAMGLVAQIEYKLGERGHLGLKATAIDYETSNAFGTATVDGNSIGIILGARF